VFRALRVSLTCNDLCDVVVHSDGAVVALYRCFVLCVCP